MIKKKDIIKKMHFIIEMAMGGREGRRYRTGGCGLYSGYIRVRFVLGSRWFV